MKIQKDLNKKAPYYIAKEIKAMLDKAKKQVKEKDWDRVYIIDGEEGSGKSLLGLQIGKYLDPTLNLDRICFNGKNFSDAISKSESNQCLIFDEAFNGLDSGGTMTKLNRLIVRKLMECRQKNLFIIIILPTIFLLQKYAAIFRSRCLFHVYATNRGERGYYRIYNKKNKKILYLEGKKFYSYAKPLINNSYRYYGIYPIDEEQYRDKKLKSLTEEDGGKEEEDKYYFRFGLMCRYLKKEYKMAFNAQAKYLNQNGFTMNEGTIARIIKKIPKYSGMQFAPLIYK